MGFLTQLRIGARLWVSHGLLLVLMIGIGGYVSRPGWFLTTFLNNSGRFDCQSLRA
jgi:hypothetical protein